MTIGSEIIGNKKTHHQTAIPTEDSQPSQHLPQEIIFDILSRLPVKHLLRFRSVCRSWLSLISNHQFVKSHLSIASNTSDQRLVLNAYPSLTGLKSCSLDSVMEGKLPDNAVEFDYPSKELNQFVYMVGSCGGLMCVATYIWDTDQRTIYLWNPSTRKSKRLPDLGVRRGWNCHDLYGFGFDESNDDYKVVLIFCNSGGGVSAERKVMVYTLRTDSWRQIGGISCDVPFGFIGKFLNGSIHWVVRDNSGSSYSSVNVIVSLDLEKETYNEVLLPNYGADVFHLELCVLKGSLGVLCMCRKNYTDVWIMKEYGTVSSWTKLFTIQDVAEAQKGPIPRFASIMCISNNGKYLILFGQKFSIYSPKNGTSRNSIIRNWDPYFQICTYVESLVSPNADNVVPRQHQ
ncbi:F-box/kelch-repeat protein At3g23880-like [Rhododendron vialii]|uniref:F-box/kelch-repeat protein At3g23880-like n=1 Tax=Rhododendron vialii TaxID=182163 RepID=UPI00265EEE77|nr:F-box/kelch-repeat protein At3g23880-like [Rhododendron vialii]XP_058182227.1 F-box/kelch-repeat protein At3g23880-like [Rhododendron vialii]